MRIASAVIFVGATFVATQTFAQSRTGFVQSLDHDNSALIVSVGHGLPGLDSDVQNVTDIANNASYKFNVSKIEEDEGTIEGVEAGLTKLSEDAGENGTAFFYYTGHGSPDSIYVYDGSLEADKMRAAVAKGREGRSPLARLVMVFDSCYSGSLLDPMRVMGLTMQEERSALLSFVDNMTESMTSRGEQYWKSLMIIASSRADQTSAASQDGSIFTLAMKKAFDEVVESRGTVGTFFDKAHEYTLKRHEPVARFVPESIKSEPLVD